MKAKRLCKLCVMRPAAVPDRNSASLIFRKEVCRECHAARLAGDLDRVLAADAKTRQGA